VLRDLLCFVTISHMKNGKTDNSNFLSGEANQTEDRSKFLWWFDIVKFGIRILARKMMSFCFLEKVFVL